MYCNNSVFFAYFVCMCMLLCVCSAVWSRHTVWCMSGTDRTWEGMRPASVLRSISLSYLVLLPLVCFSWSFSPLTLCDQSCSESVFKSWKSALDFMARHIPSVLFRDCTLFVCFQSCYVIKFESDSQTVVCSAPKIKINFVLLQMLSQHLNTLRTGLLNCLNARSRGLTFRHRASCI